MASLNQLNGGVMMKKKEYVAHRSNNKKQAAHILRQQTNIRQHQGKGTGTDSNQPLHNL